MSIGIRGLFWVSIPQRIRCVPAGTRMSRTQMLLAGLDRRHVVACGHRVRAQEELARLQQVHSSATPSEQHDDARRAPHPHVAREDTPEPVLRPQGTLLRARRRLAD